ncbi:ATPase, putative [Leishmania panamensis]|uniref:ATPase, putative n=1 Tax=Leishmania panamensis TaxID=5679 RepID=A0A088RHU9_LEIPA|nr:ATPase, putative [Leishmania panamensis]AIN95547.1 ATPase, putative [Leishmania panamensis]
MFRRAFFFLSLRPSEGYRQLLLRGDISNDENQVSALPVFDRLHDDLVKYAKDSKSTAVPKRRVELRPPNRLGIIPSFFLRREQEKKVEQAISDDNKAVYHPLSHVKGLYVWGGVGCGKTMLMDLLYDNAPPEIRKRRLHFHQFMLDMQKTSKLIRYKSKEEMQDPTHRSNMVSYNVRDDLRRTPDAEINLFDEVAQRMISDVDLLCFDEVAVSDVAHAMILKRLFHSFYKIGLVVIFTSNRPVDDLYKDGLNRGGFIPFIDLVKKQCIIHHMKSNIDHRLLGHQADTYLTPMNDENHSKFEKLFLEMCKAMPATERKLEVFGRDVIVPRACGGVCYFHFLELCGGEKSTADYEVIARAFHTIFINGVPQFPYENSDVKNRFLLLIDTLYEHKCKVMIHAAVELLQLQAPRGEAAGRIEGDAPRFDSLSEFERESGNKLMDADDSAFQMDRCVSRLFEMRTKEYLEIPHEQQDVDLSTR